MGQNTMPDFHAYSVKFCEYFLILLLCVTHFILLTFLLCDGLVLKKREEAVKRFQCEAPDCCPACFYESQDYPGNPDRRTEASAH